VSALRVGPAARSPRRPEAGRPFRASWPVRTNAPAELVRGGRVACSAQGGGSKLRVLARSLRRTSTGAVATCRWRLPGSLKGRRVRGSVVVSYDNRVAQRKFSFRAR
jgi:hypothetical protein